MGNTQTKPRPDLEAGNGPLRTTWREQGSDELQSGATAPDGPGTFTRFVNALIERSDGLEDAAEAMWDEMRRVLVRELKARSLWSSPPAYVGVIGHTRWSRADAWESPSALDDLLSECYLFIFDTHLIRLSNQLKVRPGIDGLVVFYLRQFLTHLQRNYDPIGYRLFEMIGGAIRAAVGEQRLFLLKGPERIRNSSVLGIRADLDPSRVSAQSALLPLVVDWNHELLPDLILARYAARRKVSLQLGACLESLGDRGVRAFLFKDLLDAFKRDVRARWSRLAHPQTGETAMEVDEDGRHYLVQVLRPQSHVDDLDSYRKLLSCVFQRIPRLETRAKTRLYLDRLWNFLRYWSSDDHERVPSNRELAKTLDIPRDRFPRLFETLGELSRCCQELFSGSVVDIAGHRVRPDSEDDHA